MEKRTIILIIALFVLVIIGMFSYAYIKNQELDEQQAELSEEAPTENADGPYADITRVTMKHFYENGTHTFVGEIPMPTPCDLLEAEATQVAADPAVVRIDFNVINNADTCAQVITPMRFLATVDAPEDAEVQASFMGRALEVNLLDPAPGETPDDFELFIKG